MTKKTEKLKACAVGINHVALEVGDIDEALEFYSGFLEFEIHEKSDTQAFIYFGDQFINFTKHSDRSPDEKRHLMTFCQVLGAIFPRICPLKSLASSLRLIGTA